MLYLITFASLRRTLTILRFNSSTSHISFNRRLHTIPRSSRGNGSFQLKRVNGPLTPGATLRGQSGRIYTIQEVLVENLKPLLCIYRARYSMNPTTRGSALTALVRAEGRDFVIKNMIPGEYEYQQDLQKPLSSCPNLRTVIDGLIDAELFIYPFLQTDFLQFTQKNLTNATRKSILESALNGLAAMHDRNIIHTGKFEKTPWLRI